jgi:beta-glucanase (GH16 family)
MKRIASLILLGILFLTACSSATPQPTATPTVVPTLAPTATYGWNSQGWNLAWSDEFNNSEIDSKNWVIETGTVGRQNAELQYYTNRPDNVRIENGLLVITALREKYEDYQYTSGRLNTQGLQEFQYGRIEARMKLPPGQGMWSAFWMLGNDFGKTKAWPICGEIDILDYGPGGIGTPKDVFEAVHGEGYSSAKGIAHHYALTVDTLKNDFHVYAIEWSPNEIHWFVDDQEVFKMTPDQIPAGTDWAFNHPFFLLLNLAVGGSFGYPTSDTVFPQQLQVDYVRVYQKP